MATAISKAVDSWLEKRLVTAMKKRLLKQRSRRGQRGAYRSNSVASGRLLNSIRSEAIERGDKVVGLVFAEDYAEFVDQGRGPGGVPPIDAIRRWTRAKGVDIPPHAIAKAIAKRGTNKPPAKFIELSLKAELPRLGKELDKAATQAGIASVELALNALTLR